MPGDFLLPSLPNSDNTVVLSPIRPTNSGLRAFCVLDDDTGLTLASAVPIQLPRNPKESLAGEIRPMRSLTPGAFAKNGVFGNYPTKVPISRLCRNVG
jgi:hypothetical protein